MKKMYPVKRILVGLDRSSHDEVLLTHVSRIAQMTELDAIYFLHVANDLEIPPAILEKYPDLIAPVDESISRNIEFDIRQSSDLPPGVPYKVLVREGSAHKEILKAVQQKEVDLLILGRKSDEEANLNLVKKILRAAPCSVSVIPEFLPKVMKKILVPIDFSDNSLMAIQQAHFFSTKYPGLQVVGLHVYHVPSGYSKTGKSFKEFSEIMRQNAEAEHDTFLRKHDIQIPNYESLFVRKNRHHLPGLIYQFAITNNVDAILIGSRGRDAFSSLIVGSVAEGLIEHDQYLPLIVVKDKRDHMDLMEAITGL